jgi:predicted short-subunit dehydrogenase-like oxidoreductase (DUF2520 family)
MARKPSVAVVGPGRLGAALAVALAGAGYRVIEVVARRPASARALARKLGAAVLAPSAPISADVVWICVPDGEIAGVARQLARACGWEGTTVLHPSGALSSTELAALRRQGAAAASCHPMMSFTRGVRPTLRGVPFTIEGDARAVRVAAAMARALGGEPLKIAPAAKPLYHAFGAFGSPLIVALLAAGEQVGRAAGVPRTKLRRALAPMLRQTLENYLRHGAAAAFSGPLVRGDLATVRRHLAELKKVPGAREVYVALARSAVRNLPVGKRREIGKVLQGRRG